MLTGGRADEGSQKCVLGVGGFRRGNTCRRDGPQVTEMAGDAGNAHQPALLTCVAHLLSVRHVTPGVERASVIAVSYLGQLTGFLESGRKAGCEAVKTGAWDGME